MLLLDSSVPDSSPLNEVEQESDLPAKKSRSESSHRPPTTRTPLVTYEGHNNAVTTVVWAGPDKRAVRDGDIITGGWDNCIRMWDSNTGANKVTLVRINMQRDGIPKW
jgi:WD40 repeat protein